MVRVRNIVAKAFTIVPLREDKLDSAFNLATDVFIQGSTLHRALKIGLSEYRTYLRPSFEQMIREGLSVAAFDDETGEIIGCLIATDFFHQSGDTEVPRGKFAPLTALTRHLCKQYHGKRQIRAGEVVLADMGVVAPHVLGMGVYQQMRFELGAHVKALGFSAIVGELSSATTQHVVVQKLGHRVLAEVEYATFEFDGGYPFSAIKEPRRIILAEGQL